MNTLPPNCDVCKGTDVVGVASSTLGAISFAYCRSCIQAGVEPYWLCVATAASCGGLSGLNEWARETIDSTLRYLNKTDEEFLADVERETKAFNEYMEGK